MKQEAGHPVYRVLKEMYPRFKASDAALTFEEFGLDSFDLLELRVWLENKLGRDVPDDQWVRFRTFRDVQYHYATFPAALPTADGISPGDTRRVQVNMPQMTVGRLSEHWLLKELGDMHWTAVCDALGGESHTLTDDLGNRLYATFVRVRWQSSVSLAAFQENDVLDFENHLSRFGRSMFFSECRVRARENEIKVDLMTTFAAREGGNRSLLKGEPVMPKTDKAEEKRVLPPFAEEYKEMRKGQASQVRLRDAIISTARSSLFETTYHINPYQDLNGVNLLYFAAYPLIADICERQFMHHDQPKYRVERDWALESPTTARDIFYYGNADIDDRLTFRINSFQLLPDKRVAFSSSLYRESDGQVIADLFTMKAILG